MIRKYSKEVIAALFIVLLAVWGTNNLITMRRYERVISGRLGLIVHPVAPDFIGGIAAEGEISKEMAENLKGVYQNFWASVSEMESLLHQFGLQVPGNTRMYETTKAIYMFFMIIENELKSNEVTTLKLNDKQIEQLILLQELSDEWIAVSQSYSDTYKQGLYDIRSGHWANMFMDLEAIVEQFEVNGVPLSAEFYIRF